MELQAFLLCVYTPLFTLWAAYVNELLPLSVCSRTKAYVRAWEENLVTRPITANCKWRRKSYVEPEIALAAYEEVSATFIGDTGF